MENNMKVVRLKNHNTGKEEVVGGKTWEELYSKIVLLAWRNNISTLYPPEGVPTVAKYWYEDTNKLGVVLSGKDLGVNFGEATATNVFAAFVVAELKSKDE